MTESRLFFSRKEQAAGYEKKYEHPRTLLWMKKSDVFSWPNSSSGSAQRISHINPWVGGSRKRSILRRSSRVCNSGLKPPWIHKNCLFMTAANGREQKLSIQASYTRSEYLCLPGISLVSHLYPLKCGFFQDNPRDPGTHIPT